MAIVAESGVPIQDDGETVSVPVTTVNDVELEEPIFRAILDLTSINNKILEQMKLLNARFEESFDTRLDEGDI